MTKKITVYALPGTMCDERVWSKILLEEIAFAIRHIDVPRAHSIDEIVQALEEELPEEPINMLGFSLGGYLASAFCSKNPKRIKHLAVLSNAPCALPPSEITQRQQMIPWIEKEGYIGITSNKILSLLHDQNANNQDIVSIIRSMDQACGKDVLLQQLSATTQRKDIGDNLGSTQVPVRFFYGEQDRLVDPQKIISLCDNYSNLTHSCFHSAGHMLPLEAPAALSGSLNDFFIEQ